jgi:hypothetical protein
LADLIKTANTKMRKQVLPPNPKGIWFPHLKDFAMMSVSNVTLELPLNVYQELQAVADAEQTSTQRRK